MMQQHLGLKAAYPDTLLGIGFSNAIGRPKNGP